MYCDARLNLVSRARRVQRQRSGGAGANAEWFLRKPTSSYEPPSITLPDTPFAPAPLLRVFLGARRCREDHADRKPDRQRIEGRGRACLAWAHESNAGG